MTLCARPFIWSLKNTVQNMFFSKFSSVYEVKFSQEPCPLHISLVYNFRFYQHLCYISYLDFRCIWDLLPFGSKQGLPRVGSVWTLTNFTECSHSWAEGCLRLCPVSLAELISKTARKLFSLSQKDPWRSRSQSQQAVLDPVMDIINFFLSFPPSLAFSLSLVSCGLFPSKVTICKSLLQHLLLESAGKNIIFCHLCPADLNLWNLIAPLLFAS